jgi:glycine cleavage system regulatory protein
LQVLQFIIKACSIICPQSTSTQDLTLQKSRLNQTSYELKIKVDRESELSDKYTDIKDEKDLVEQENIKLSGELAEKEAQLELKQSQLSAAQSELSDARLESSNLEDDAEDLCDEIDVLGGSSDPDIDDICEDYE